MPLKTFKQHPLKFSTLILIIVLGTAAVVVPWNMLVQEKIRTLLVENGFENATLNLSHLGLRHLQIDTLRLAKDAPVLAEKLTLHFSPLDLINGRLNNLSFSGLNVDVQQTPSGWLVNGASLKPASPQSPTKLSIPVTDAQMAGFPLNAADLVDSNLHITADAWKLDAPLHIQFTKTPAEQLDITITNLQMGASGVAVSAANIHTTLILDKAAGQWKGDWVADDIDIKGQDNLLPTLKGSGTITAKADDVVMDGTFISANKATHISFNFSYPLNAPEKAQCRLTSAALPWNKGTLSIANTLIPLNGKDAINMTLNVEHVPVNALMTMLTGKETIATGVVSGSIPLTIKPDGQFAVGQGKLQTEQAGVIALSPETIPINNQMGDNEQIAMVRDIMKNLHYTTLSIAANGEANKKLSVIMAVEGNNPDVANGRPVKLSVQLTGDLLNFIQQSLLSLLDPHMFLKQSPALQDSHAKP